MFLHNRQKIQWMKFFSLVGSTWFNSCGCCWWMEGNVSTLSRSKQYKCVDAEFTWVYLGVMKGSREQLTGSREQLCGKLVIRIPELSTNQDRQTCEAKVVYHQYCLIAPFRAYHIWLFTSVHRQCMFGVCVWNVHGQGTVVDHGQVVEQPHAGLFLFAVLLLHFLFGGAGAC